MDICNLIDEIINNDSTDSKKIVKILSKGVKYHCSEDEICENVYREIYGDELIPSLCEELIEDMSNEERSGAIWTLEDTNNVAKKLDIEFSTKPYTPEEFRTVMTMEYYEHNVPLKKSGVNLEPTGWGRLADYSLVSCPSKLVDYYFD